MADLVYEPEPQTSVPETTNENQLRANLANDIINEERTVQEEDLKKDKNWSDAYRVVYSLTNDGEEYGGDDETAATEALDFMSKVNYNLSLGTIPFATTLAGTEMDDTQKIAVRYLMDTYDKKDVSWDGAVRFGKAVGTDVTSYIGAATFGWGFAGKAAVKEVTKRGLMEATKLNVKQFAKSAYGAAALEGAVYTAADDAAFQNIKISTGEQEEYSPSQTAIAGGIGAVVAPTAVKGLSVAGQKIGQGGKYLAEEMSNYYTKLENEVMAMAGGGEIAEADIKVMKKEIMKQFDKMDKEFGTGEVAYKPKRMSINQKKADILSKLDEMSEAIGDKSELPKKSKKKGAK